MPSAACFSTGAEVNTRRRRHPRHGEPVPRQAGVPEQLRQAALRTHVGLVWMAPGSSSCPGSDPSITILIPSAGTKLARSPPGSASRSPTGSTEGTPRPPSSLPTIHGQFRGLSLGHVIAQNLNRRSGNERPWQRAEERPPNACRRRGEGSRAATRWPAAAPTALRGRGSPATGSSRRPARAVSTARAAASAPGH